MQPTDKRNPAASVTLGGELATGWDSTERLPVRLESFGILKQRSDDFTSWAKNTLFPGLERFQKKTLLALDVCGSFMLFREYPSVNRSRMIGGCTCKKHLLCSLCASRRGVKNSVAYKQKIDQLKKDNPDFHVLHIIWTVKNGADLWERFTHIKKSMQALLRHRNNQALDHRRHTTEMFKLTGGVFAFEVKRGEAGAWHPHLHMLALLPKTEFIDAEKLKAEWLSITGDSTNVRIVYCENNSVFLEVFAYALKFSELENVDRWNAAMLLRKERLISSFGELRGIEVDKSDNDELLEGDLPYYDLIFSWQAGRYVKTIQVEQNSAESKERIRLAVVDSAKLRELV